MVLVDTNVLIDVLERDPDWWSWSLFSMRSLSRLYELAINPVVYAELSTAFATHEELDDAVQDLGLRLLEIPRPALFLAGKAFARYRRDGGSRPTVLPDFFIGAHAAVSGLSILTRDVRRYRNHFPGVKLVAPA